MPPWSVAQLRSLTHSAQERILSTAKVSTVVSWLFLWLLPIVLRSVELAAPVSSLDASGLRVIR